MGRRRRGAREGKKDMKQQLVRVALAAPRVHIAAPEKNVDEMLRLLRGCLDAQVLLLPELAVTGYTCGDLFHQTALIDAAWRETLRLAQGAAELGFAGLVAVGVPVRAHGRLFNCAAYLYGGEPVALVPKTCLPNYAEFYEKRWFAPAGARRADTLLLPGPRGKLLEVPFGEDLLLADREGAVVIGTDVCEDLWVPVPPSSYACLAGANLVLNPSASNETVTKEEYRRQLVTAQAARCCCAYAYASAGRTESTTDLVFSGHGMICENGTMLAETLWPDPGQVLQAVVDLEKTGAERVLHNSFLEQTGGPAWRTVRLAGSLVCPAPQAALAQRPLERLPFVPATEEGLRTRCAAIARIQATGLAQRMEKAGFRRLVIGVSGGLDSTLALLAARDAMEQLGLPAAGILGVSMPCVGTTKRTRGNAQALAELLGAEYREIDIRAAVEQHLRDLGHAPEVYDVTFENAQARERTQLLMDLANQENALVVGTGDLSELALGWCTYNGDHMSMYGVNASVPKTLVKALVGWHAKRLGEQNPRIQAVLLDILDTPISPELLPVGADGELVQRTEETLGKYDLHDFALYHMLRGGYGPERIFEMARLAWPELEPDYIRTTLTTFYRRFFSQQFKRSCLPDGPKVGSVSLSPRGDWRMPSDADPAEFLKF